MKPAGEAGLPLWKTSPGGWVPGAAHPRTWSPLQVPGSRRRLVRALPHGFFCVAPLSYHALRVGVTVPVAGPAPRGVSLQRGCPLCCGFSRGPRPVFDLLRSNVASCAPSKRQPALNSAGTGSKEEGKPGEAKRSSVGFSYNLCRFFILQF